MARFIVEYSAPVFVTVNTDTGEVEGVSVGDEALSGPTNIMDESYTVVASDTGMADASDTSEHPALLVAEGDTVWPAWVFG